jgi:protein-disulfide isomerase
VNKYRQALERDPRDFVANPNGSITVVEFFDYRCGYCKLAAPQIVELIQKNPDVRFVFKDFVIFGTTPRWRRAWSWAPRTRARPSNCTSA